MADVIENAVGRFGLDGEGIIRCVVKDGTDQTREQAEDSLRIFGQLAGGKRRPAVIDSSGAKSLSRDARACYTGREAEKVFAAVALVVANSVLARSIGNFVLAVSKPAFPLRMFETVDDAMTWARTHPTVG
jgi:hypothetical protein